MGWGGVIITHNLADNSTFKSGLRLILGLARFPNGGCVCECVWVGAVNKEMKTCCIIRQLQLTLAPQSVAAGGPTAKRRLCFFSVSFPSLNETHRLRSHTLLVVRNSIHPARGATDTCDSMQTERQADDNNSSESNLIAAAANTNTKKTNQSRRGSPARMRSTFILEDCTEPILASCWEDTCRCSEAAGLIKGLFG